jgi:hypothetical protein
MSRSQPGSRPGSHPGSRRGSRRSSPTIEDAFTVETGADAQGIKEVDIARALAGVGTVGPPTSDNNAGASWAAAPYRIEIPMPVSAHHHTEVALRSLARPKTSARRGTVTEHCPALLYTCSTHACHCCCGTNACNPHRSIIAHTRCAGPGHGARRPPKARVLHGACNQGRRSLHVDSDLHHALLCRRPAR